MEVRKIYVTGGSTFVVSLPKKWVESQDLKAGDSVFLTQTGKSIIIEPGIREEKKIKEKKIRISMLPSPSSLERLIIAYYLTGYDTISIILDREDKESYRRAARRIKEFLIGVEIVEDTTKRITMEILVDHQRMPVLKAIQRIHLLCKSMLHDLIEAMNVGCSYSVEEIQTSEKEVDRLYFLVVRQLKSAVTQYKIAEKLEIKSPDHCLGYRSIVKSMERISDHLDNIAKYYSDICKYGNELLLKDGIISLGRKVTEIYEKSMLSLFKRDPLSTEEVFNKLDSINREYSELSDSLFKSKAPISLVLCEKSIIESLERIARYSSDICEIVINMYVK